jgi:hypothetical protein
MKKWFRRFTPISWEGWAIYLLAVFAMVWDFRIVQNGSNSFSDTLINFFPHVAAMFLILVLIIKARREV